MSAAESSEPRRPGRGTLVATGAILAASLAFYAVFVARSAFRVEGRLHVSLFDDAMISLSYARNLAEGHGLVWMPGAAPVEGYTNFLWTLVMALPHAAGLPDRLTSLPVLGLGAVLLVATSLLAMQVARRLARLAVTPVLVLAATAFSYPLLFWTLRGLEVGLVACLGIASAWLALRLVERPSARDRGLLGLAIVLVLLTRTDALALVAVVVAFLALHAGTRREACYGALAALATLAAHTAFRLAYYGSALPNTYTLKLGGHPLAERLARGGPALFDLVSGDLLVPVGLAAALLLVRRASLGRGELLLFGLVAAAMAYSVWVGGDVWEFAGFANRFVAVALPALFVLAVLGLESLLGVFARRLRARGLLGRTGLAALAGVLLIVATNARPFADWVRHGGLHVRDDELMVRTALAIRAATRDDARVAVVWAGAIPYFSRRPSIDLFGKSDPTIAHLPPRRSFLPGHDKWDFAYSIGKLRPELVVLAWSIRAADRRRLERWGYEKVAQYWVLRGADVDRRALRAPWR